MAWAGYRPAAAAEQRAPGGAATGPTLRDRRRARARLVVNGLSRSPRHEKMILVPPLSRSRLCLCPLMYADKNSVSAVLYFRLVSTNARNKIPSNGGLMQNTQPPAGSASPPLSTLALQWSAGHPAALTFVGCSTVHLRSSVHASSQVKSSQVKSGTGVCRRPYPRRVATRGRIVEYRPYRTGGEPCRGHSLPRPLAIPEAPSTL